MSTFINSPHTFADIEKKLIEVLGSQINGTDTEDRTYKSIQAMWAFELRGQKWYKKGHNYWESEANCPLSDDGVLGGYGRLTDMDSRESNIFLNEVLQLCGGSLQLNKCADCGAGIGRVSKHFLLTRFQTVDLIEQSPRLLAASDQYIGPDHVRTNKICVGLQDFSPLPNTYDAIWIQWVIGHLHDLDFISFFMRCAEGLKEGGVIFLKDNVEGNWTFCVDRQDSSVARCKAYIELLLSLAGLNVLASKIQIDFPEELTPVYMFAIVKKTA